MPKHNHIHIHHHHRGADAADLQRLETLIMSKFDDLSPQVHALTEFVNTIPNKIAALLASSGGQGATDAQLQALSDEIKSDLSALQSDFPASTSPAAAAPATPTPSPTA